MTSRERLLAAVAHQQPDRVPVDLGATPSSGISAIAYGRLKRHLGMTGGHTRVYDVIQQLAQPEDAILDRFQVDVVDLGRSFNTAAADWYDMTLFDGSPAQYPQWFHPTPTAAGGYEAYAPDGTLIAVQLKNMNFFDQTCFPWQDGYPADVHAALPAAMGRVHWGGLPLSPWDHVREADFWSQLREHAVALRQQSDRAIIIGVGCNLFEWGSFLRRMDNFLMDLVEEPAAAEAVLEALMERHLGLLEKVCAAVGDVVDIVKFGDDLGMDTGPFMSRATYRSLFQARHARLFAYVKQHSQMIPYLHSCGSIHQYLPDLIEAGLAIINPVQTNCSFMEPERLKREFGRDITFWGGGCDTRTVLNHATPAEVKAHVQRRLAVFNEGGGFVFNTVHNILPDVPPENVVAMFDGIAAFNRGG